MEESKNLKAWKTRGKTIDHLIKELHSFENKQLEVRISVDGGETSFPISLVGKHKGVCLLEFIPD